MNNRDLLVKELDRYGVKILNNAECSFSVQERKFKSRIVTKIYAFKKDHTNNTKIIQQLLLEVVELLNSDDAGSNSVISPKIVNISIDSLYGIWDFVKLLTFSKEYEVFLKKHSIREIIRKTFDKDYSCFSYDVLNCVSNYRIALDWTYRQNRKIEYMASLLDLFLNNKMDKIVIKEAKGIQGPWGNLDLPMQERVFSWDEVAGETYGRDKDKRNQQRYKMGYDTYNKTGKVGEGYYWREIKNEPFAWKDRYTDSPYPQLAPGAWR